MRRTKLLSNNVAHYAFYFLFHFQSFIMMTSSDVKICYFRIFLTWFFISVLNFCGYEQPKSEVYHKNLAMVIYVVRFCHPIFSQLLLNTYFILGAQLLAVAMALEHL